MERVLGIGGVFFKAHDPKKLADWYRENLGISVEIGQISGVFNSTAEGEITAWSTFPEDTQYFGGGNQSFMLNYRVENLEKMLNQLRVAGAKVDEKVEEFPYGRFGWAYDPEGNRFEMWQPKTV
ncbi:MAG: VOC family protein [Gemmataceae bacterium]